MAVNPPSGRRSYRQMLPGVRRNSPMPDLLEMQPLNVQPLAPVGPPQPTLFRRFLGCITEVRHYLCPNPPRWVLLMCLIVFLVVLIGLIIYITMQFQ